jgi:hypothetical protein
MRGHEKLSVLLALTSLALACGPPPDPSAANRTAHPDLRFANGRPPVVVLGRDGDPAASIAVAVTTTGVGWDGTADDPEPATALAALVDTRLRARGIDAQVSPAWDGLRASMLASSEADATRIADAIRDVMSAPAGEVDVAPVRKKLAALGQRPLHDKSLGRYARCVGEAWGVPERVKDYENVDLARIERWRAGAFGLGHVAIAATGRPSIGEAAAKSITGGPQWKMGAPIGSRAESSEIAVDAYEGIEAVNNPAIFVTLDAATSGAAVATAEALGDPRGPLAARLADLDPPFRLREVTGAAHARGGCTGVILEATTPSTTSSSVADAAALVRLEGMASSQTVDGRLVARRSGDAREAAERAAWWALVDQGLGSSASPKPSGGSVTLVLPAKRGVKEDAGAVLRDSLAAAVTKAAAAWDKPVVEARTRIENGQGEAWVLVGSPCGADGESDAEAGLSAIFATAAAEVAARARGARDMQIEPWVAVDGVGLLAHGPPAPGESPSAHARRLADVATRAFAAEPLTTFGHARADLLQRDVHNDGPVIALLASQLSPTHTAWIDPWGSSEPIARSSDGSVLARIQSLRAGPLRIAMLANTDNAQADAAVHAADRWVTRHGGEPRACRAASAAQPPKPGTYSMPSRPGAMPEAYLAYPFAPGDEASRAAATMLVASLETDGVLARALNGLARESSARILGWPRSPALVVRVVAPQASLDSAVMQVRALFDQLRRAGLAQPDYDRAVQARARAVVAQNLDPRARIVATWRGEPLEDKSRVTVEDVRAFAAKALVEDSMVVVTARPPRPPPEKPEAKTTP